MDIDFKKLAIAGGLLYAAYKFAPNQLVKGGVLSIAAVITAKQVPFVKDYI